MVKNLPFLFLTIVLSLMCVSLSAQTSGKLRFTFVNTANNKPIVLNDSTYTTPNGEVYTIKKLRYYTSNFQIAGNTFPNDADNYQLIDQSKKTSFEIQVKAGVYKELTFLLGIDSTRHVSGAQDGALDPMNDMFWTWSTGYVVFKLDGESPVSTSDRNRIEHHIGGYRFNQNVSKPITISFKENELNISADRTTEIEIEMNLDAYWNNLTIAENPVITVPNATAQLAAANFTAMFRLIKINQIEN